MASINQSLVWNDVGVGAHYNVRVRNNGDGIEVKVFDAGTAVSVPLSTLLSGLDLSVESTFRLSVQSKLADGSLPSAYSPETVVTVTGYPAPNAPTVQ